MKYIALVWLIILPTFAPAQWTKTSGPEGGAVSTIFNDPTSGYIFAGGNGIYRSSNNGATWSECSVGMNGNASPVAIVRSGSKLYAGSLNHVYVSSNNGDSWSLTTVPAQVLSLGVIGNALVAGTDVYGVYWSTNEGATWTAATGFPPFNNIVQTITTYGTKLLAGLGGKGVWASTDSGKTWATSYTGTVFGASHSVNSLVVHGSKIFAANSDSGVFVSTNGGSVWSHSSTGMNPRAMVRRLTSDGTTLYAHVIGAYSGVDTGVVYRSTNDGASWVSVKSDLYSTYGYGLGCGTNKVFFATWAGLYASTDNGAHWFSSNTGLSNANPLSLASLGSTLFAGYVGGVSKTEDGGATWTPANNGLSGNAGISALTTHGGYVFAATSNGSGVMRSGDNGASWTPMNNGLSGFGLYGSALAAGGGNVYLGTMSGIYVSTDNGGSWTGPGSGLPGFGGVNTIFVDGADIWAGISSNGIYRSTNGGSSWTAANNGLPAFSRNVSAITRSGSTLFAGLTSSTTGAVYVSTDNGANWVSSSNGIPNNSYVAALHASGSFVFAGFIYTGTGVAEGLYRTSDGGANWAPVNQGFPTFGSINAIAEVGSELFGSYLGVWKRPLSQVTHVREVSGAIPQAFLLRQNYPNPFNPGTEIRFEIPKAERALLRVYDIVGREVTTLVDKELLPGSYAARWDANDNPAGVYYYRLQTGSQSETRKMMLIK